MRRLVIPSPLRLTLQVVALFAAVTVVSFAYGWWTADQAVRRTLETTLEQETAQVQAEDSPDAIAAEVARITAQGDPALVMRYDSDAAGAHARGGGPGTAPVTAPPTAPVKAAAAPAAGDARLMPGPPGSLRLLRLAGAGDPYLVRTVAAPGGALTVGVQAADLDDLSERFLSICLWTLIPSCMAALGGGMLLAHRSLRRVEAIEATLTRLTAGRLDARMPADAGPTDDLQRIGRAIDTLAAAQQSSVEALRQVSADIAHDLKTPLQRLSVLIAEARAADPADAGARERARTILDRAAAECQGMAETFRALLDIAQLEGRGPRTRFARVDLGGIAQALVELYEPSAADSGHRLALVCRGDTSMTGDRVLLGRLLANLLENGLRHTPPGSSIAITVAGEGRHLRLTVADDGPGIPEAERGKVTRRLYRLESSRTTPGSGLGLSLVEAIARLHDAPLVIGDNAPGVRISVDFPRAPV